MSLLALLPLVLAPLSTRVPDVAALVQEYSEAKDAETRVVVIEYAATVGQKALQSGEAEAAAGIAALLGTTMWDEAHAVQLRAVQLAGEGQDPTVVALELFKRCEEPVSAREIFIREARRKLKEKGPARTPKNPQESSSGLQNGPVYPHAADQIGDMQRLGYDYIKKAGEIDALDAALIDSLDGLQDPQSVEALALLLNAQLAGSGGAIVDALLRHGTVDALRKVLASLPAYEKRHRSASKEIGKLRKEKPGRMPKSHRRRGGDKDSWIEAENERIRAALAQYETVLFTREQLAESLKLSLVRFAKERDLPDPPKEILPAKKWSYWFNEVKESLPVSVVPASEASTETPGSH